MFSGYESPITQILGQMQTQMEDECMKVVQQCGFDVNKEELARALIYDRGQYSKGYDDGYREAIDDFTEALKQDVMAKTFGLRICDVDRIAEQLKEGSAE